MQTVRCHPRLAWPAALCASILVGLGAGASRIGPASAASLDSLRSALAAQTLRPGAPASLAESVG